MCDQWLLMMCGGREDDGHDTRCMIVNLPAGTRRDGREERGRRGLGMILTHAPRVVPGFCAAADVPNQLKHAEEEEHTCSRVARPGGG